MNSLKEAQDRADAWDRFQSIINGHSTTNVSKAWRMWNKAKRKTSFVLTLWNLSRV